MSASGTSDSAEFTAVMADLAGRGLLSRTVHVKVGGIEVQIIPADAPKRGEIGRIEQAKHDEEIMYASSGGDA